MSLYQPYKCARCGVTIPYGEGFYRIGYHDICELCVTDDERKIDEDGNKIGGE